jgi:hypothetical protein
MPNNYRWEQCYELDDAILWAIVDDESHKEGLVTSHLLVVNHEWAESLGTPFPECDLPKRIVAALNNEERLEKLESELEDTSNKLADVWLHLDSWARGEATSLDFVREAAASILRHQQAPGWKTPVKGG